jgi:tellurium resistance protein TerD
MLVGQNPENAVPLKKGVEIPLEKAAAETGTILENVTLGFAWDKNTEAGEPAFDIDGSILFLKADGTPITGEMPIVYYRNLVNSNGSVIHSKDERTGETAGYDETIKIKLKDLPAEIGIMEVGVTIHEAEETDQNFGQIDNAAVDVVEEATGKIAIHIDLTKQMSDASGLDAVKFTREPDGKWSCKYVGQKVEGMKGFLGKFGMSASD